MNEVFMKTVLRLCFLLLSVCLVTISCKKENPVETPIDKTEHYYLNTVDGYTLEKHKLIYGAADYPLEFKFTRKDSIFRGYVIFEKMGEKRIDSTGTNGTWFSIDINNNIVDALYVVFHTITIKDGSFECLSAFYSPTADYRTVKIVAKKR